MLKRIKTFKGDFPLVIEENPPERMRTLESAEIGDVFIREGSLCMRVKVQTSVPPPEVPENTVGIINLQTGAVWFAESSAKVVFVDANLQVKRYYD